MDGLKYLLREIEARRFLLHDFQKHMDIANSKEFILAPSLSHSLEIAPEFMKDDLPDAFQGGIEAIQKRIKDSKEFTLFSEDVPDFVIDGLLVYEATPEAEPVITTVKDFNTLYKKQFNDLRINSFIHVQLWPNESPPDNYELNEMVGYSLGKGLCDAYLIMQIWSPSIKQPDRQLHVYVEDRYVPEERASPRTKEGVAITPETYPYNWWEQDSEEQAKMARGMQGASLYNWWEQYRREAKTLDYPAEIVINENTTSEQIWGQLLFSAWRHNYLSEAGQTIAYEELKRYYRPEVIDSMLMHLSRHSFNPYDSKSNLAYLNSLSHSFRKIHKQKSKDLLYRNAKNPDGDVKNLDENLSIAVPRLHEKSVLWASLETGIPQRTIYHLIKEGEIQANNSNSDVITLTDDAVNKLKKRANEQDKRKAIFELAEQKGKSHEAIKKWLQRHRDLPENEFRNELSLWLKLGSLNKQSTR